jgi:DNA polymerase III delta prime subunit
MPVSIKSVNAHVAARAAADPSIRSVLVAGPPGVGKTTFCFMMADYLKLPAWKFQCHAESTPSEAFGMYVPKERSFEWVPGPLDQAYSKGGILILDEIVEASGPVKTALYGALDDGRGGEIAYVGRTFVPHKKYKCFATMNGWPYEGGLPEALLDRFDATFILTQPNEQQLALLDADIRDLCLDSYLGARDPMIGPDITYRMWMGLQKLRGILPIDQAALSAAHGNEQLAGIILEALALADPLPAPAAVPMVKVIEHPRKQSTSTGPTIVEANGTDSKPASVPVLVSTTGDL